MPRNLELKAFLHSRQRAEEVAKSLGAEFKGTLKQVDVYYRIPHGRLKMRSIEGGCHEMIYYVRPNRSGGRFSDYTVVPLRQPRVVARVFEQLYGIRTIVRKHRRLYLYKNARIHLDSVRDLGDFLEFEVMVVRGVRQAGALLRQLTNAFGIRPSMRIASSYSDLMDAQQRSRRKTIARDKKVSP